MLDAKVCPSLATLVPNLDNRVKNFIEQADKSGYDVVVRSWPQILEKKTSFYIEHVKDSNNVEIHLIVHIPMVQKNELLEMYKFLPQTIPIRTNGFEHGLEIKNKHDVIAFSDKQEKFITFMSSDLGNCEQTAEYFFCDHINSIESYSELHNSCLGSLLKGNSSTVLKACPSHPSLLKATATKISPNEWLLYSPDSQPLEQECSINGKKTKLKPINIKGFERQKLGPNCRAKFGSNHFHSAPHYEDKAIKTVLPVVHDFPQELPEHMGISGGTQHSDDELLNGFSKLDDPNQNTNNMQAWKNKLKDFKDHLFSKDWLPDTHQWILYALFILVVVVVVVVVARKANCKCVCATPKGTPKTDEQDDDGHIQGVYQAGLPKTSKEVIRPIGNNHEESIDHSEHP